MNTDNILTSIKQLLGVEDEYGHFDPDIILAINTVLAILWQLGIGTNGFTIKGGDETWEDFLGPDQPFEAVKSYVHLRTRLLFDPPQSSALIESINKMVAELEWRIFVHYDPVTAASGEIED